MSDSEENKNTPTLRLDKTYFQVGGTEQNSDREDEMEEERNAPAVHTKDHTEDIKKYFAKRKEENDGYESRAYPDKGVRRNDDEGNVIQGFGAVTETRQEVGPFIEVIERGAFRKTVKENDVRGLFNHDPNFIIGRTSSGTLRLEERDAGLFFVNEMGDTAFDEYILSRVQRGDVTGASIGFQVIREEFDESGPQDKEIRRIKEVKLFDTGPVTFPAFPQTDIEAKDFNQSKSKVLRADQKVEFDFKELTEILLRSESGVLCDPQDAAELGKQINDLKRLRDSVINEIEGVSSREEDEKDKVDRDREIAQTKKMMLELM